MAGFAEPARGTDELAALARAGILRYLVPVTLLCGILYHAIHFAEGLQASPFSAVLVLMCAVSFALDRTGRHLLAVTTFMFGTYLTLLLYSVPYRGTPSGLASGVAYTFSLYPVVVWVCYANRHIRVFSVAAVCATLVGIFLLGAGEAPDYEIPSGAMAMAALRIFLLVAVSVALVQAFERASDRMAARWQRALDGQRTLNRELDRKRGDLAQAARAHRLTLDTLQRSQRRYRQVFDNAFDGIAVVDPATGKAVEVNPATERLLGYGAETITQLTMLQLSCDEQHDGRSGEAVRAEVLEQLDRGQDVRYYWRFRHRDGKPVDVEVFTSNLPGREGMRVSLFRAIDPLEAKLRAVLERRGESGHA